MRRNCPLCDLEPSRVLEQNDLALAVPDAFPVSPGHTLVITRRHVADFFELSRTEVAAIMDLVFRLRDRLVAELAPNGFNLGVNSGTAAGQTIMHVHVHLVPRFFADVSQPEGGIRNIIPGKGPYRIGQ
jgi:diadenosine tetraphosphate (Ap4A) HIT family hydrolase